MGLIRAISDMGPIWDPHVRSNNTYDGFNAGSIRAINDMGPIRNPRVRSDNTYGVKVGSIWVSNDMSPIRDPHFTVLMMIISIH